MQKGGKPKENSYSRSLSVTYSLGPGEGDQILRHSSFGENQFKTK
jgi:hypothetical protein